MNEPSQKSQGATRRPTPRPHFEKATHVKRSDMALHVWGDALSGFVTDRVISSTKQLHVLEYELAPGGEFRHSASNQTVFAADVLYFVVEGELVLANPQTGEVVSVKEGTGRLFHRGTWNHGFNPGQKNVRVIEYFSPPPAMGAASEFSKSQPALPENKYDMGKNVKNWPENHQVMQLKTSFWEVSDEKSILSFRDAAPTHLIATVVSTQFLQVIKGTIQPGHMDDFADVEKESLIYMLEGQMWVDVFDPAQGQSSVAILEAGEAMFLPAGVRERLLVQSSTRAVYLRGSAEVPSDWKP